MAVVVLVGCPALSFDFLDLGQDAKAITDHSEIILAVWDQFGRVCVVRIPKRYAASVSYHSDMSKI